MSTAAFFAPIVLLIIVFSLNATELRKDSDDWVALLTCIFTGIVLVINLAALNYYLSYVAPIINGR